MSDLSFPYTIRRSARAKNIRVSIKNNTEVILVLPKFVPEFLGLQFLKAQKKWIQKHLVPVSNYQEPTKKTYKTGTKIQLFGKKNLKLQLIPSSKSSYDLEPPILKLYLKDTNDQNEIKLRLTDFYKSITEVTLYDRVDRFCADLGLNYNRICLKNNKTNWGSCSSKKNLNFNWRIIMAPVEIIDYLVIHEVCHLKQMNHSSKFWNLVESLDPNFKAHKKWLRENGKNLVL